MRSNTRECVHKTRNAIKHNINYNNIVRTYLHCIMYARPIDHGGKIA